MAKASSSQAWLWHHLFSHLNFDTINLLSKYDIVTGLPKLKFVKDHLFSSCELGKAKRIEHQTSTARTPEQNNVVKRQNHTLVEAAQTMLSATKVPLFFWAEAIATACFTQNRSLFKSQSSKSQNVPEAAETITTSNELDLLFSPMFDELLNGTTPVVSKSFVIHVVDAPNQRQQQNTTPSTSTTIAADTLPLNTQTTPETTSQAPTQAPTVTTTQNINQGKTQKNA
nr:integrase, catalytic region, zinc finger, CCHC-type, peptidase aspartic, catalytic [Tanacetum cinerariifolium]